MSIKKTYLIILFSFYSSTIHAFAPYTAIYDLYADTSMGNYKIGIAEFSLERNDNNYIYSSSASTTSMWSALYKFSRQEKSIGTYIYDQLVSRKYSIVENVGDNAEKNISIVINQSGTNPLVSEYLSVPVKKNIPIISSIHTSLLTGINNFSTLYENIIKPKIILKILMNTPLKFLITLSLEVVCKSFSCKKLTSLPK